MKQRILAGNLHDEPLEAVPKRNACYDVDALLKQARCLPDGIISVPFTMSSFVFVLHPSTHLVYFFSGIEAENREDGARRVNDGVEFFVKQGYFAYELSL